MHIIERMFHNNTTDKVSPVKDLRDHVSMSLQVSLAGNSAVLYGTLFDNNFQFIPITIPSINATTITSDGMYVIPPYFRYYRLNLIRTNNNPVYAYLYAVKEGAFLQESDDVTSIQADGEFDLIRKNGIQQALKVESSLTTEWQTLGTPLVLANTMTNYTSHVIFNTCGQGGAIVEVVKTVGLAEEKLRQISLTGAAPFYVDPIPFLEKIDQNADATISVRAKRFLFNHTSNLFGRVITISR